VESRTRRRLSALSVASLLIAAGFASTVRASVGPIEQTGFFALVGSSPKIVSKFWAEHGAGLSATLKIRQYRLDGKPILAYDIDMERLMHMVIVRDDFATFAHLHPSFDATTGTFQQSFTKQPNHRYYVYADSAPRGVGQQVFRFNIESDGSLANSQPSLSVSAPTAIAGPYSVTLSQTTLPANRPTSVNLSVLENGQPAADLGTYLGAAAHAVFINTSTLAYVHVHPMARGSQGDADMMMGGAMSAKAGPFMRMTVPALPGGTYKLWLQFRGANDKLYTVAFTIAAR
jgi:hypothetical protein